MDENVNSKNDSRKAALHIYFPHLYLGDWFGVSYQLHHCKDWLQRNTSDRHSKMKSY